MTDLPPEQRIAAEERPRELVAQLIVDVVARQVEGAAVEVDLGLLQPREQGIPPLGCRRHLFGPHCLLGAQLGGVARDHVAEAAHLIAEPRGQQPLAFGPGHGADEQVRQDAAGVGDDAAAAAVEGPWARALEPVPGPARAVGSRPLHRAAARRVPPRGGQLEGDVVADGIGRLEHALSVRGRADHHRAVVVLKGPGDELGRAGRAAVHEHGETQVVPVARGLRQVGLGPLGRPAHGSRHRLADVEEQPGHRDAFTNEPARIGSQVEHERGHALGDQRVDRGTKLVGGALTHPPQGDVADVIVRAARLATRPTREFRCG